MFISDAEVLIFALRVDKGWMREKMMREFLRRNWKLSSLSKIKQISAIYTVTIMVELIFM